MLGMTTCACYFSSLRIQSVNDAVWITVIMVVIISLNVFGAGAFRPSSTLTYFAAVLRFSSRCLWRGRIHFCFHQGLHHCGTHSSWHCYRPRRWTSSRSDWVPSLEGPGAICSVRRDRGRQRKIPRLVECHYTSSILIYRNRSRCGGSQVISH